MEKECVIWPVNLDKRKSRKEGRKIPRRLSVPNVKLNELVSACKELEIKYRVEEEKKYPRCWWESGGRIFVEKRAKKTHIMIEIAKKILELREKSEADRKKKKKRKKR
ncbi:signal recognition particle, subunit SRP19 (srp19) [Archaeoglobus sulfaticallidus PM70-1]|uniref:Signal recognition particle 19 kDa protein n=1 Tax=Archaeoglobus sulfaticallidus PM70-1 TaxID=387631 RepID=N0BF10_9EURY|nr:signal recognition particle subunit SRP19/SEC65 family protein [Archaeoglobus sulfaticallidus]AGK60862.1 signal recognition particle, subunit SRP19 (srp19) [Archaeoglobus sulfaticallidus PM70-1]